MQYIDCYINPVSRSITYPTGTIVVQRDTNVETLRFHFPLDAEHELENDSIRIMVLKNGETHGFNAENVRIESNEGGDQELVFEHKITTFETVTPGQISVSVCGNQISGDIVREAWHTLNMNFQISSAVHSNSDEGEDTPEEAASNAEKIAALQTLVNAISSGTPKPAQTASEMTDTDSIYVYTGSEPNYSNGYWYYYNGTNWVLGSKYGDTIPDTTLTLAGSPADAKATGDKIAASKPFVVQVPGSAAVFSGSITAGDFAKALAAYTAGSGVYVVKDGEVYQLSAAGSSTMTFTQMYHGTMNFIKQIVITSADTFTVTNTALSSSAEDTSYSNATSGLAATNVQAAIDENAANLSDTNERLGDLSDLETEDKSSFVNAINEARGTGSSDNGLDETAQELLIDILTNAVYTSVQSDKISALEYSMSGGKTKYTITYNLTGATSSNNKAKIFEGAEYSTTITANAGYVLQGVVITMGGVDITSDVYLNGRINISEVTGNIVITATGDVQMTMLKSINLANGAYVNTGYLIQNINEKYLIGVQLMTTSPSSNQAFAGVSRRPATSIAEDNYLQMSFKTGGEAYNHSIKFSMGAYRKPKVDETQLRTANGTYVADTIDAVPFYMSAKNGEQLLKANEDMTEDLVTGSFKSISSSVTFSCDVDMPIDPIYLGTVNNAGAGVSGGAPTPYTDGVKIYCFKVYDENNNLVVNMHPVIRGSAVGMYDSVRATFYEAENGVVGTDITYDEVTA